jgi:phenylalanyl-tRNA synthetase beta chain
MKISLSWLKDFIDLTQLPQKGSDQELTELLTNTGLEVEGIETIGAIPGGLKGFVVGQVNTCERFQHNDKQLSLTTVNIGSEELLSIVCGAANVAAGQKVIVATPGTELYDKSGKPLFKIEKRKVYGHPSEGMICAEDEIGLGNSHDGILILDDSAVIGTPAAEYFNIKTEKIIEIGLTPNRADAASHWGVARDIYAISGIPVKLPKANKFTPTKNHPIKLVLKDEGCRRFCGITIQNIQVKESPDWLKSYLGGIGLKSINNIVDITNYICHGFGLPMHAYDCNDIKGDTIIVQSLVEGTKFITLDGVERKLNGGELMICDGEKPIGLAGIMGGENSEIKENTKNIFLELANFDPTRIRKSSQFHGLKTDASFRFERGVDIDAAPYALAIASQLVLDLAGGEIASELQDIYPNPVEKRIIETSIQRINQLIGIEISSDKIKEILERLDFEILSLNEKELKVLSPNYRVDVDREADLVEEVLRIYGLDNVPLSENLSTSFISDFPAIDVEAKQLEISKNLNSKGFFEIITNSITKNKNHELIANTLNFETVEITNPLSEELGVMRQSLVFQGLETLAYNFNRKQQNLKFFEFGKTYHKKNGKIFEKKHLGLFVSGNWLGDSWLKGDLKTKFVNIYQTSLEILQSLGLNDLETKTIESNPIFAYGLEVLVNKKSILNLGLIQPDLAKKFEMKQEVFYADFDWDYLAKNNFKNTSYTEISKFPEVRRDLSLVIEEGISFQELKKIAFKYEQSLLKRIFIFDIYKGENLGEGKKSYSVGFILQDESQTLTDKVIDASMNRLIKGFESEIQATIRR